MFASYQVELYYAGIEDTKVSVATTDGIEGMAKGEV
jgi:hypothetical protein